MSLELVAQNGGRLCTGWAQVVCELPSYLAAWDVAILPFALNEATRFINPHQTLECLAAGRSGGFDGKLRAELKRRSRRVASWGEWGKSEIDRDLARTAVRQHIGTGRDSIRVLDRGGFGNEARALHAISFVACGDEEKTMQEQPNQSPSQQGGNGNQREGGLSERTEEAAGRAREAAIERVEQVRDRAREGIDRGKQEMADRIRRLGSALHTASDNLRAEDSAIARYGDIASETIERAANYVGSADLKTTVRDVENFARREPALFFGGAFLLGLAAGRFLRSSAGRSEEGEDFTSPRTRSPLPDTATDWPKPPPPISVSSTETQGVFDTNTAPVGGEGPDPTGVRGRRTT